MQGDETQSDDVITTFPGADYCPYCDLNLSEVRVGNSPAVEAPDRCPRCSQSLVSDESIVMAMIAFSRRSSFAPRPLDKYRGSADRRWVDLLQVAEEIDGIENATVIAIDDESHSHGWLICAIALDRNRRVEVFICGGLSGPCTSIPLTVGGRAIKFLDEFVRTSRT